MLTTSCVCMQCELLLGQILFSGVLSIYLFGKNVSDDSWWVNNHRWILCLTCESLARALWIVSSNTVQANSNRVIWHYAEFTLILSWVLFKHMCSQTETRRPADVRIPEHYVCKIHLMWRIFDVVTFRVLALSNKGTTVVAIEILMPVALARQIEQCLSCNTMSNKQTLSFRLFGATLVKLKMCYTSLAQSKFLKACCMFCIVLEILCGQGHNNHDDRYIFLVARSKVVKPRVPSPHVHGSFLHSHLNKISLKILLAPCYWVFGFYLKKLFDKRWEML